VTTIAQLREDRPIQVITLGVHISERGTNENADHAPVFVRHDKNLLGKRRLLEGAQAGNAKYSRIQVLQFTIRHDVSVVEMIIKAIGVPDQPRTRKWLLRRVRISGAKHRHFDDKQREIIYPHRTLSSCFLNA
jgi:hypothetical protein